MRFATGRASVPGRIPSAFRGPPERFLRSARSALGTALVEEVDEHANPIGVKGIGEIGIVGVAAAVANAVYHATGKRVRDLPITIDKLL